MYGSTRFAIYETIKNKYKWRTQQEASVSIKICAATFSGFIGGIVGNPADWANVRMQSDSVLPPTARRNYRSVIDAFVRFKQEEGWRVYTRGVWANSSRASIMTACQLASYDAFKDLLISQARLHDSLGTHFAASVLAGLVATTICNPVHVIKSRIMSLSENRSILYVARNLWQTEGKRWLFRGWAPSFIRTGPHTVATFIFLEQHKNIYRSLVERRQ
jgi:dicarboxylate transporter 10